MSLFRKALRGQLKPKTNKELWTSIGRLVGRCVLYTVGGYVLGYGTVYAMYFLGHALGSW